MLFYFFSEINHVFEKLSKYLDRFNAKFSRQLSVTKIRLQDRQDIKKQYFEFKLSGKILEVKDHKLKRQLMEQGIIIMDADNELWFTHFIHQKEKRQKRKTKRKPKKTATA